jgi:hypothetical protein
MPNYMLLLYADEPGPEAMAAREAEMPAWLELHGRLQEAGSLVATGRLHPSASATTVRVRHDETELTDGPFAVTKEVLAGFYLLECGDLDEALQEAARVPLARYGSVEVRPLMDLGALAASDAAVASQP